MNETRSFNPTDEGWCVIDPGNGFLEIQKDDDSDAFVNDEEAEAFVLAQCADSPEHLAEVMLIKEQNDHLLNTKPHLKGYTYWVFRPVGRAGTTVLRKNYCAELEFQPNRVTGGVSNVDRSQAALNTLQNYTHLRGNGEDCATACSDLLADVLHLAAAGGESPLGFLDEVTRRARSQFIGESEDPHEGDGEPANITAPIYNLEDMEGSTDRYYVIVGAQEKDGKISTNTAGVKIAGGDTTYPWDFFLDMTSPRLEDPKLVALVRTSGPVIGGGNKDYR